MGFYKYYAVRIGEFPGIYFDWVTQGQPALGIYADEQLRPCVPSWKGFNNLNQAKNFMKTGIIFNDTGAPPHNPKLPSPLYMDAEGNFSHTPPPRPTSRHNPSQASPSSSPATTDTAPFQSTQGKDDGIPPGIWGTFSRDLSQGLAAPMSPSPSKKKNAVLFKKMRPPRLEVCIRKDQNKVGDIVSTKHGEYPDNYLERLSASLAVINPDFDIVFTYLSSIYTEGDAYEIYSILAADSPPMAKVGPLVAAEVPLDEITFLLHLLVYSDMISEMPSQAQE